MVGQMGLVTHLGINFSKNCADSFSSAKGQRVSAGKTRAW